MSKIPDTPKTKYNHNDPFRWVDSQWEKYMTEQKELKRAIKQLQDNLGTCTENYQKQRKQLEDLVLRVPSSYLTGLVEKYPNDNELGNAVRETHWKREKKEINDEDSMEELLQQMDLFEDK